MRRSGEEVVMTSRAAAASAMVLAVRKRDVAMQKEEIAAKKMAAAKRLLDLAAFLSEEEENKERYLMKKKERYLMRKGSKKHILAQGQCSSGNRLHEVPETGNLPLSNNGSSPRISKGSQGPKSSKHKKQKANGNGVLIEVPNVRVETASKLDEPEVVANGEEAGASRVLTKKFDNVSSGKMKPSTVPNNLPNCSVGPPSDGAANALKRKRKALKAATSVEDNRVQKL